jgi:putative hydrolase of the HAD superfamily
LIRAVFFDIDDTLVDFTSAARQALAQVLGQGVDMQLWEAVSRPHWQRFHLGEVEFTQMRVERTLDFLRTLGRDVGETDAAEIEHLRMNLIEGSYRAFDDVLPCLESLAGRRLTLGVISNNDAAHQLRKLTTTGLRHSFHTLVFSADVGSAKPDAAIFRIACERAGVRPDEAMHVGDMLDADALGAHRAGLRGVWLDRASSDTGHESVTTINELGEVADLL